MHTRCLFLVGALAVATLAPGPLVSQDSVWTFASPGSILGWSYTAAGILLVHTDRGLLGVDAASGRWLWERPDLAGATPARIAEHRYGWGRASQRDNFKEVRFGYVQTTYGIAHVDSARARAHAEGFDITTGRTLWDSRQLVSGDVRGVHVGDDSLVILTVEEVPSRPTTIVAVNVVTGQMVWTLQGALGKAPLFEQLAREPRPRPIADDGPSPFADTDSTLMLFLTPTGPVRVHRRSGEIIWRMRSDSLVPARREWRFPHPTRVGDVLLAAGERELVALDLATGLPIWRTGFMGVPAQIDSVAGGILVRVEPFFDRKAKFTGKAEMTVVEARTGESRWSAKARGRSSSSDAMLLGDSLAIADGGKVHLVSLADGGRRTVYDFGGYPGISLSEIDTLGGDFLVASRLLVARVSRAGELRFRCDWGPLDENYAAPLYFYEGAVVVAGRFKVKSDSVDELGPAAIPGQGPPDSVYKPRLTRIDLATGTITHQVPFEHLARNFSIWRQERLLLARTATGRLQAFRF